MQTQHLIIIGLGLVVLALCGFILRRLLLASRRGYFDWGSERIVREEGPTYFKINLVYGWTILLLIAVPMVGGIGISVYELFTQ